MPAHWKTNVSPEVEARISAALSHREGDRVPVWECIENPALVNHFAQEGDEPLDSLARAYRELGVDVCPWVDQSALPGCESESGEKDFPITSLDQLEAELKEEEPDWEDLESQLREEYFAYRDLLAPRTMFVPTGSTGLNALYLETGLERFCEWMADAPELLESVLRKRARDNRRWAETVARERLCPIFLLADDVACKNRLLFSPRFLRRVFLPAVRTMCEPLAEAGVSVIFHSDGDITELLPELIEAGIHGIHPIEPLAGMNIAELKREHGDSLVLVGNVDSSQLLPNGTPEEVRRAARECLRIASPGGGHFIGSSGQIGPGVPLENALAFFEACREYGRYGP